MLVRIDKQDIGRFLSDPLSNLNNTDVSFGVSNSLSVSSFETIRIEKLLKPEQKSRENGIVRMSLPKTWE